MCHIFISNHGRSCGAKIIFHCHGGYCACSKYIRSGHNIIGISIVEKLQAQTVVHVCLIHCACMTVYVPLLNSGCVWGNQSIVRYIGGNNYCEIGCSTPSATFHT